MKPSYQVFWSETAERDLICILDYIATDNPAAAVAVFQEIQQKAAGLYTFPERGRIVPELQAQGITQYRELIIAPWRIMFRIAGQTVYVLSVLDSRRNLEDILLQRLIRSKL